MATSGHYADDGAARVQIVDGVGGSGSALVPGTGATNLGKAEDAVHTSGDVGIMPLGVANATLATLSADGDYTPLGVTVTGAQLIALGQLRANGADAVSNSGVFGRHTDPAGQITYTAVTPLVFNGTSWDRLRGDVNGLWVTSPSNYETVAASQTAQALGATGATGDYIDKLIIIPATTAPGVVTLLDNATSIPIWVGGTVGADLKPFVIDLGMKSVSGAWKITTGANVSVIGVGRFT